ncbi:MAG: DegT/DnrJ/EryC1/StrS aminotransferase family protein [Leptospirales bacterium]|nr:DegT/DnrJ/EryC1/StrS aminotransferase family protein [Leptospirales bacterium]
MKILSNKPTITRKELEGVLDSLIHDELNNGGTVKAFETALSEITGLKYPLAVNSLVSAYLLIFKVLEIGPDDEVIIPSFFSNAAVSALKLSGGIAKIADSNEGSIFPGIDQIKEKITGKTKAIIAGDIFGFHFEGEELKELNIPLIADISHSIGSEFNEKPAGSWGTFMVASFAASMIITTGNGAMILTNNSRFFSAMRELRGYNEESINFDFTMTDMQGAMGITQVMKLKDFLKRRREIAQKYYESIRITTHKPLFPYNDSFSYQCFPVIFDSQGDKVEKYWKKWGIEILKVMPFPLHVLMGLKGFDFPNADRLSKKLYSVPLYPTLTKKEIDKISKLLSAFI